MLAAAAKGFVFVSLEDETGTANAIITPQFFEKCRLLISEEPFLMIEGIVQNIDRVIHVKALSCGSVAAAGGGVAGEPNESLKSTSQAGKHCWNPAWPQTFLKLPFGCR